MSSSLWLLRAPFLLKCFNIVSLAMFMFTYVSILFVVKFSNLMVNRITLTNQMLVKYMNNYYDIIDGIWFYIALNTYFRRRQNTLRPITFEVNWDETQTLSPVKSSQNATQNVRASTVWLLSVM